MAIPVLGVALNEVLKSQGYNSDIQNQILDPMGFLINKVIISPFERAAQAKAEADIIKAQGEIQKTWQKAGTDQLIANRDFRLEVEKEVKRLDAEAARIRVPAESRKLNQTYQLAVNNALKNPIAQQPTITKPLTRTTEQQVADREIQQKLKTLRAQLQPATSGTTKRTTRALPPSVSLKGKGKLLIRVMDEFNMDKKEARKYLKKYGSN